MISAHPSTFLKYEIIDQVNKEEDTRDVKENTKNQQRNSIQPDNPIHKRVGQPGNVIKQLRKSIVEGDPIVNDPRKKSLEQGQKTAKDDAHRKSLQAHNRKSVSNDHRRKSVSKDRHRKSVSSDRNRKSINRDNRGKHMAGDHHDKPSDHDPHQKPDHKRKSTTVHQQRKSTTGDQQRKSTTGDQQRKSTTGDQQRKSTTGVHQRKSTTGDHHHQSATGDHHHIRHVGHDPHHKPAAGDHHHQQEKSFHDDRHRKKSVHYDANADFDDDHRNSVDSVDFDGFKLDAEVAAKLDKLQSSSVAFLSSSDRRYYPEFPGYSKFGQEFQAHLSDPTLPPPEFYKSPLADLLAEKPISRKGYGIGGLSAPRFPRLHSAKVPAPNQYQKHIQEFLTRQHRFPPQVWMNYGLLGENDKIWDGKVARKLFTLWGKCHQMNVGFGKSIKEPRFGKDPKWNLVGPGNYCFHKIKVDPPRVFNTFLQGPSVFNPTTKLHCSYGPKDHCIECDVQLMGQRDYYRSRFRVNPTPLRPIIDDTDEHTPGIKTGKASTKRKAERVLLCRKCFCNALHGGSRYWKTRAEVERLFEKTRHCGYLHEHNEIPEYTLKASCYWTRRLAQKESVLSRHYPDVCEKRIVERKQKFQS